VIVFEKNVQGGKLGCKRERDEKHQEVNNYRNI
jgi:hypothetical protein